MPLNTYELPLFENIWELTKETRMVLKSIWSNRNYSAILATPSVVEIAEWSRLIPQIQTFLSENMIVAHNTGILIWNRHRLKNSRNRYQSWPLGNFHYTRRSENVLKGIAEIYHRKATRLIHISGSLRQPSCCVLDAMISCFMEGW
jgi:hypothetical protein